MSSPSEDEAAAKAPAEADAEVSAPAPVQASNGKGSHGLGLGRTLVLIVLIIAAATIAIWFRFFSAAESGLNTGMKAVDKAIDTSLKAAVNIARQFSPEYVNETFIEWAQPTVRGNEGNILEIATATATESFASRTYYTAFGKEIPGSNVVSRITVPATYRYHINLNGDWHLVSRDQRMYVVAPIIEPSLPVAIDTARMKKEIEGSWMRVDEQDDLDALQRTLTTELALRAADPETIEQIGDEARLSVAKFVKAWLLSQDHWRGDGFTEVIVLFDNEVGDLDSYDFESRLPTLRWSDERPPEPTGEAPLPEPKVLP